MANKTVLKEKNVCTASERLYVIPSVGSSIIAFNTEKGQLSNWFFRIFLPQGYPHTVSKDYIAYQKWDTAQAFCSTITGILATQEVLRGVGVGDQNSTPLAATITWIFKDGCGHIGRILFAYSHGTYLDAYSKKWRIYADILNNAAMCIEIALPLFESYTPFALCVSTVMKSIVGVAGGASRVAMTQHHAVTGNFADVSAKDAAQETAVNLVASLTALLILTTIGNSLSIFMLMMVLHITFNYLAVRAVCLRTLNEPRFLLVIDNYLKKEVIATPCEINRIEPIIYYQMGPCLLDLKLTGFRIKLGNSLKDMFKVRPNGAYLANLTSVYSDMKYILVPNLDTNKVYVMLKDGTSVDDVFCSYFHAILLAIATCAINDVALSISNMRPFAKICDALSSAEWSREKTDSVLFEYAPSSELMKFMNNIVKTEWPIIKNGLQQTGWDLSKHLFIVDQWRVQCHNPSDRVFN